MIGKFFVVNFFALEPGAGDVPRLADGDFFEMEVQDLVRIILAGVWPPSLLLKGTAKPV
jgi:hypothetical protein